MVAESNRHPNVPSSNGCDYLLTARHYSKPLQHSFCSNYKTHLSGGHDKEARDPNISTTSCYSRCLFLLFLDCSSLRVANNMLADVVGGVEMINWWQCVDDIEAVCSRRTYLTSFQYWTHRSSLEWSAFADSRIRKAQLSSQKF